MRNNQQNLAKTNAIPVTWSGATGGGCDGGTTSAYPYRPDPYNKAGKLLGPV